MRVRFVVHPIRGKRIHHVTPADVEVVLRRLPGEVLKPLKEVHFNDFRGGRYLGYADAGSGCLALCAMPERISFSRSMRWQECGAQEFGATLGSQWPALAVRRYVLYGVLLHELGHLQVLPVKGRRRGRIPGERMAREFTNYWRRKLWSQPFDHPDRVHNPPAWDPWRPFPHQMMDDGRYGELIHSLLSAPQYERPEWHRDLGQAYELAGFYEKAEQHYRCVDQLSPNPTWLLYRVGYCRYLLGRYAEAVSFLEPALERYRDHLDEPDILGHLAVCLWRTGEKARCEQLLARGVAEFPSESGLRADLVYVRKRLKS